MIVYSIQMVVDESVQEHWLKWMTETHMPDVMKTGCFNESKIYRVVAPAAEDGEGDTFVMQYHANSLEEYERYQISHAAILQAEHKEKFKGKFTAFRTLMEEL